MSFSISMSAHSLTNNSDMRCAPVSLCFGTLQKRVADQTLATSQDEVKKLKEE
jgi:hypothetical protein